MWYRPSLSEWCSLTKQNVLVKYNFFHFSSLSVYISILRAQLEVYVEHIPLENDKKAVKVLRLCEQYELLDQGSLIFIWIFGSYFVHIFIYILRHLQWDNYIRLVIPHLKVYTSCCHILSIFSIIIFPLSSLWFSLLKCSHYPVYFNSKLFLLGFSSFFLFRFTLVFHFVLSIINAHRMGSK